MTEKDTGSRESLRMPWSLDGKLPGQLSPGAEAAALLERNVPLDSTDLQGAEAPRPGQGKALAPREPTRGGGGEEVEKEGVAARVTRGKGRRRWDVDRVGWRGTCLSPSVSKSVGLR